MENTKNVLQQARLWDLKRKQGNTVEMARVATEIPKEIKDALQKAGQNIAATLRESLYWALIDGAIELPGFPDMEKLFDGDEFRPHFKCFSHFIATLRERGILPRKEDDGEWGKSL